EARALLAQVPGAEPADDPADPPESELLHRALELIRGDFEPRTWEAFWQTAVEGRAAADVAADLGMTPGPCGGARSCVLPGRRTVWGGVGGKGAGGPPLLRRKRGGGQNQKVRLAIASTFHGRGPTTGTHTAPPRVARGNRMCTPPVRFT